MNTHSPKSSSDPYTSPRLASWITRQRQRLGLTTHALGLRSGVPHRILYYLEQRGRTGLSAHNLLQLATYFHQQDPSIDVSLPTLLALTQKAARGRHARTGRRQTDPAA